MNINIPLNDPISQSEMSQCFILVVDVHELFEIEKE
jgi:hypothetical protein